MYGLVRAALHASGCAVLGQLGGEGGSRVDGIASGCSRRPTDRPTDRLIGRRAGSNGQGVCFRE